MQGLWDGRSVEFGSRPFRESQSELLGNLPQRILEAAAGMGAVRREEQPRRERSLILDGDRVVRGGFSHLLNNAWPP